VLLLDAKCQFLDGLALVVIMKDLKATILLLTIGLSICQNSFGQKDERKGSTIWGLNYGVSSFNKTNFELGFGFFTDKLYHKGKTSAIWDRYVLVAADLSSEFQVGEKFIFGPKISNKYSFELWDREYNYLGFVFGADYIAYNDLKTINNVLRPSIGLHYFLDVFELSYGYNIRLDNNYALPINTHIIQFKFKPFIFIKSMKKAWGDK